NHLDTGFDLYHFLHQILPPLEPDTHVGIRAKGWKMLKVHTTPHFKTAVSAICNLGLFTLGRRYNLRRGGERSPGDPLVLFPTGEFTPCLGKAPVEKFWWESQSGVGEGEES